MRIEYKIEPPDGPDFGVFKYTHYDVGEDKLDYYARNSPIKKMVFESGLLTECEAYIRIFGKDDNL